jgi:predicted ribosome quality control (RQC) complex YloA/Tae2 family protein
MDFFVLAAVTTELRSSLSGWRIRSCAQINDRAIGFVLMPVRSGAFREKFLLFDLSRASQGIFVHEESPPAETFQTQLAKSFRNKAAGARILDFVMPLDDRIVVMRLNAAEWPSSRSLVFDLKHSPGNLLLLDRNDSVILECLTKTPSDQTELYPIVPGLKVHPDSLKSESVETLLSQDLSIEALAAMQSSGAELWRCILKGVRPMTPELAKRLQECVLACDDAGRREIISTAQNAWQSRRFMPLVVDSGGKAGLLAFPVSSPPAGTAYFKTMLEAASYWRQRIEANERWKRLRAELAGGINRFLKKLDKNLQALTRDLEGLDDEREVRMTAELLAANYHLFRSGMKEVEVIDYYDSEQKKRIIAIEPGVPISVQIARMFKKAGKIGRARPLIKKRISDLEHKRKNAHAHLQRINATECFDEIRAIEMQLMAEGLLAGNQSGKKADRVLSRQPYMKFRSTEGWEILVGRGAKENDILTFQISAPHDFWLHAKGFHGAHVLIRNPEKKKNAPQKTLEEAARLAVFFSKARGEKAVAVIAAPRNKVRKAPGGIPGRVVVPRHETVLADSPDESAIRSKSGDSPG